MEGGWLYPTEVYSKPFNPPFLVTKPDRMNSLVGLTDLRFSHNRDLAYPPGRNLRGGQRSGGELRTHQLVHAVNLGDALGEQPFAHDLGTGELDSAGVGLSHHEW